MITQYNMKKASSSNEMCKRRYPQQTQNICITLVQCWINVGDVEPTLYKCYTKVLYLLCHYLHIQHGIFTLRLLNAGPASQTMGHDLASIWSMSSVCWAQGSIFKSRVWRKTRLHCSAKENTLCHLLLFNRLEMKWNEMNGVLGYSCAHRINWVRSTSWGWWD